MDLTDWLVLLAIALTAVSFYCSRGGRKGNMTDRARYARGKRLLMLAAFALWSALVMLHRCFIASNNEPFALALSPRTALAVAFALGAVGIISSFRASRLLKTRRIFGAC
jgi:hypothetical protein